MPQVYNGGQSPLEFYAINGRPSYPGSGRIALLGTTFIGTGKYAFQGPYKNPVISGSQNTKYSVTSYPGSGRSPQITNNAALWGYGPSAIAGSDYTHPNTSQNVGQVII